MNEPKRRMDWTTCPRATCGKGFNSTVVPNHKCDDGCDYRFKGRPTERGPKDGEESVLFYEASADREWVPGSYYPPEVTDLVHIRESQIVFRLWAGPLMLYREVAL